MFRTISQKPWWLKYKSTVILLWMWPQHKRHIFRPHWWEGIPKYAKIVCNGTSQQDWKLRSRWFMQKCTPLISVTASWKITRPMMKTLDDTTMANLIRCIRVSHETQHRPNFFRGHRGAWWLTSWPMFPNFNLRLSPEVYLSHKGSLEFVSRILLWLQVQSKTLTGTNDSQK